MILNYLWDNITALKACSLVCASWLHHHDSRCLLFKKFKINLRSRTSPMHGSSPNSLIHWTEKLFAFYHRSPHVCRYIESLYLSGFYPLQICEHVIGIILSHLPNLKRLTVRYLTLQCHGHQSTPVLSRQHKLDGLVFYSWNVMNIDASLRVSSILRTFSEVRQLLLPNSDFVQDIPAFPSLRVHEIGFIFSHRNNPTSLNHAIASLAPGVRGLLIAGVPLQEDQTTTLDLKPCINLEHISISSFAPPHVDFESIAWQTVQALLTDILTSSASTLNAVHIYCGISRHTRMIGTTWSAGTQLDSTLSDASQTPALRDVHIHLGLQDPTPQLQEEEKEQKERAFETVIRESLTVTARRGILRVTVDDKFCGWLRNVRVVKPHNRIQVGANTWRKSDIGISHPDGNVPRGKEDRY
ncbi:hypothetical protein BXZ70DRAFT_906575 [Cristinia sonorae]|uniref:Uncharacterized protein n=1 Tax=Cristinia sonorae TaxID=1940300 RepID=A0A8K0XQH8_9AGAR|nr:hypothetical protein BXZ70DRAFT_906575 [Cristinia sonorae]